MDVAVAQVELGAERLEAAQVQVDRAGADGAAAGQRDDGVAVARQHRPEHQDRGAHLAHDLVVGAVVGDRLGADDQHAALLQARHLAAEATRAACVMVRMSESRGALVSVTGSSVSSAAGISVRQAFLAPEIGMAPCSRWPPCTRMLSMVCLLSLFLVACSRRRRAPASAPCAGRGWRGAPRPGARISALFPRPWVAAAGRSFPAWRLLAQGARAGPERARMLPRPWAERPCAAERERALKIAGGSTMERGTRRTRCRSSGVEHSLGKGEVQSSNLCGSTIK